ncbi:hypothetical protein DSM112329_01804 [Paraconexibacter sp. AEG42_29]|uniref:EfeO-type cupredoxin-like domain-containing protein n=1 Tax=Paraconexibacter sp. AEG42_29 TaxID=2997339 RepID=A0AAU7ATE5_9ACTN
MTSRHLLPALTTVAVAALLAPVPAVARPDARAQARAAAAAATPVKPAATPRARAAAETATAGARAATKARKAKGRRVRPAGEGFVGGRAFGVGSLAARMGLTAPGSSAPAIVPAATSTAPMMPVTTTTPPAAPAPPATTTVPATPTVPATTTGTTGTTPPTPPTGTTTPTLPDPPVTPSLGIQVDETPTYRMLLSRTSVVAGPVRLQLVNTGEDPHNALVVRTDGTGDAIVIPQTDPGRTASRSVTLGAGDYRLYCTLTTPVVHETAGMRATLTVTP